MKVLTECDKKKKDDSRAAMKSLALEQGSLMTATIQKTKTILSMVYPMWMEGTLKMM